MLDLEKVIGSFKGAGYRLTPQRRAILYYLATTAVHPSAQQIFLAVRKTHPDISLATIYNTLGTLVRLGHLKMLEVEPDNRCETNLTQHINLICTVCGKIQDLAGDFTISPAEVLHQVGFQVLDSRMEYYGVCPDCQARSQEHPPGSGHGGAPAT